MLENRLKVQDNLISLGRRIMDTGNVLEEINKAALKFLSSTSLEKLCKVIVIEAMRLAGTEYGMLYLYNTDKFDEKYASSADPGIKIRRKRILEKVSDAKKITILRDKQIRKIQPQ